MAAKVSAFRARFSDDVWAKAGHILKPLADVALPVPTGWNLLVAQWKKPDRVGSIFITQATQQEDKYQGRCGVVLAVGPDAYKGDKFASGPWCQPGDWIAWPAVENAASRMEYAGVTVTVIADDRVVLTGVDPWQVSRDH